MSARKEVQMSTATEVGQSTVLGRQLRIMAIESKYGGAGYGPPTERPIERVQQEVRDGILSVERVRDLCGVALDAAICEVLAEETARLRERRK